MIVSGMYDILERGVHAMRARNGNLVKCHAHFSASAYVATFTPSEHTHTAFICQGSVDAVAA